MLRVCLIFFVLIFFPSHSFSLDADEYFADTTTQAWKKQEQLKNSFFSQSIVIEDPIAVLAHYKRGQLYEKNARFKKAAREYRKAIGYQPNYPLVAEIYWKLGRCYEESYYWAEAFKVFGQLFRLYPGYPQSDEAFSHQFQAIQKIINKKEKFREREAVEFTHYHVAINLLKKLLKQMEKTDLAGKCQFEIGEVHKQFGHYSEAAQAFYSFVVNYPRHALFQEALFQSAFCSYPEIRGSAYDQVLVDQTLNRFSRFIQEFPEDVRAKQVKVICREIKNLKAEKLFKTASFYRRTGKRAAAEIYFSELKKNHPNSKWVHLIDQK